MHFQGVDLNLLVALDALLSEKSVTRAAERIHISQPGMSAALQKLRWHFSDQLLERVGRRLELTPLAHGLAEPLKEILFKVRQILDTEPSFNPLVGEANVPDLHVRLLHRGAGNAPGSVSDDKCAACGLRD